MSQELRISSPASERLRLTAGLFLQRQTDAHIADYVVAGLPDALNPPVPPVSGAPGTDVFYTTENRVDRDYAAFGELSYDILPNLTASAGIRGFIADNTLAGFSGSQGALLEVAGIDNCTVVTAQGCPNVGARNKQSGETHKISLKWQVDGAKMLYATYSTGFRPGGNNRNAYFNGHVQNPGPFAADTLTNYEIGWKTSWLNHTVRFNGALFIEDWDKIQFSLPGIQGIIYTVNAGKARSEGFETELSWRATPQFTLSGSGTYVDAKLTTPFCDQVLGCASAGGTTYAAAGTRLPVTPRVKLNATARYETPLGAYNAYLQGGLNYQSDITTSLRNDYEATTGVKAGFATVDFSGGLSRDAYTFDLFITNAFDKRGILGINQSCAASQCLSTVRLLPTKPQEFGVKMGYRF